MTDGICALCRKERPLAESHFEPKGLYKLIYRENENDEQPIVWSRQVIKQTGDQMTFPLLCLECERKFNRGGEEYVIANVSSKGQFPMLDALQAGAPIHSEKDFVVYNGADAGLDTEKIAYFSLSLLWRATVHKWETLQGQTTSIELDEGYKESLRKYLLGESGFPKDVVVMSTVATDMPSQSCFYVPSPVKNSDMLAYGMLNKGLYQRVFFGDISPEIRMFCCATAAAKPMFLRDCERETLEAYAPMMKTSVPIGKLAKKKR